MNEKEMAKKISLLERELTVLAEELDKSKLDVRSDLNSFRIEMESLKTFLKLHHSEFAGSFRKIKSQTLLEKNPEWISGP